MKVTVCIGSGCHVKGARKIIALLQRLIAEGSLPCELELEACFCQGRCTEGVVIRLNDEIITGVSTENVEGTGAGTISGRQITDKRRWFSYGYDFNQ